MSFLGKFLILSKLEEGEGETMSFRAQDTCTGQPVLLHQLRPERSAPHMPDLTALVFKYLTGAVAPGTHQFVEIGQDEDRLFVVTMDVPECEDLRLWLEYLDASQKARQASTTPASPPAAPLPPDGGDFEVTQVVADVPLDPAPPAAAGNERDFTRMLGLQDTGANPPAAAVDIGEVPLAPASPAAPAAFAEPSPRKFEDRRHQFFGQDKSGAQPLPPAPPAGAGSKVEVKPPEKTPRGQVPSGFEVVFQSRKQTLATSPPPAPPPKSGPTAPPNALSSGQFTQLFSEPGKRGAERSATQLPRLPGNPPAPSPARGPKQSDALMGGTGPSGQPAPAAGRPVSAPQSQSKPDESGEITQMFLGGGKSPTAQRPPAAPSPASGTPPNAPAPPAPPALTKGLQGTSPLGDASEGPGEFTRFFQGGTPSAGPRGMGPASRAPAHVTGPQTGSDEPTNLIEGYRPPSATPAIPATLEAPPPPPPPEPARKGPGEYTRLFQQPPAAVIPPVPQAGSARVAVPQPRAAAPQAPAYPAPTPPSPPQVAYQQAAPAAAKKPALLLWVLILGLGGLFVLAVALVLFFALNH